MRRKGCGEVHGSRVWRSFTSSLSQNDLWDPSFSKRKSLQNRKNQNSKKLSHRRSLSGKRAGLQNHASLGLEGKGEKLTRKFPREDAQRLFSLDHRMPVFCKLKDLTLKFLSGGGGGGGGGACMCVETETH